jgi:hypothetical protein
MKTFKQNLYNPLNLNEYKEVDSKIPEQLVKTIENSLENIKNNFTSTIPLVRDNNIVNFLIIEKDENGLSSKKYIIKIEKYE